MIGDFIQMERALKRVRSICFNMAFGGDASKKSKRRIAFFLKNYYAGALRSNGGDASRVGENTMPIYQIKAHRQQ